ncbi:MAG: 16S rRNA (uracil(1498)-N(3))-methyltransferase [Gammaproteobacteria bacterium]|nr:16S rRNA (uracil(1498)-N(3))-methyltransferase [Gammaproteobacteria bacterium]
MAVPRLYCAAPLAAGLPVELRDEALHYARNVLRLETGATLTVFDGLGHEFSATVVAEGKRSLTLQPEAALETPADTGPEIHLGIGLSRGERMDWVIQKSTELGVRSITPLLLARCNARFEEKRADNRMRHWKQVAISACEQCGRARLPLIEHPATLEHWLAQRPELMGLVLHTRDSPTLALDPLPAAARLLIGPEGGLDNAEFSHAIGAGLLPWSLGPRVLRTETAPVAALAILQFLWSR